MDTALLGSKQKKTAPVTGGHDKRYFPRWEVNKRVEYFEEGGSVFRSYTRDLSLDGVSIIVFHNPPARYRVKLRVHLADKENFEVQGRVTWVKSEPPCKMVGIAFEHLKKKAQALIMRHAFEISAEDFIAVPISCHCEPGRAKQSHFSSRLLRRCAPRNDNAGSCLGQDLSSMLTC